MHHKSLIKSLITLVTVLPLSVAAETESTVGKCSWALSSNGQESLHGFVYGDNPLLESSKLRKPLGRLDYRHIVDGTFSRNEVVEDPVESAIKGYPVKETVSIYSGGMHLRESFTVKMANLVSEHEAYREQPGQYLSTALVEIGNGVYNQVMPAPKWYHWRDTPSGVGVGILSTNSISKKRLMSHSDFLGREFRASRTARELLDIPYHNLFFFPEEVGEGDIKSLVHGFVNSDQVWSKSGVDGFHILEGMVAAGEDDSTNFLARLVVKETHSKFEVVTFFPKVSPHYREFVRPLYIKNLAEMLAAVQFGAAGKGLKLMLADIVLGRLALELSALEDWGRLSLAGLSPQEVTALQDLYSVLTSVDLGKADELLSYIEKPRRAIARAFMKRGKAYSQDERTHLPQYLLAKLNDARILMDEGSIERAKRDHIENNDLGLDAAAGKSSRSFLKGKQEELMEEDPKAFCYLTMTALELIQQRKVRDTDYFAALLWGGEVLYRDVDKFPVFESRQAFREFEQSKSQ